MQLKTIIVAGENCEIDTNACLNEPCPLQRNCTDLPPEQEIRFGRGYNCTDCPKGYNDVNQKCEGRYIQFANH